MSSTIQTTVCNSCNQDVLYTSNTRIETLVGVQWSNSQLVGPIPVKMRKNIHLKKAIFLMYFCWCQTTQRWLRKPRRPFPTAFTHPEEEKRDEWKLSRCCFQP